MKRFIYHLLAGLIIISPMSAHAISVYPTDITIFPEPQSTTDFITAQVNGSFATPGYSLVSTSVINTTGNLFELGFTITSPDGFVPQVLVPFSYDVDLGILDAGDYSIVANFYVDGIFDNSVENAFSVSSVPLPGAVWLFFSGMISLFAAGRFNKARL